MPLVDLTSAPLPNDDENADASDVSLPIQAILAVLNGHVDTTNIEPGGLAWSVMASFTDSILATAMKDSANLEKYRLEASVSFVASGLVWSALSGLNAAMNAGVLYATDGKRVSVAAIATRAFTASKDTYVSAAPAGSISYQEVANGATQPALTSGYNWLAKVVTSGSAVTSVVDLRLITPILDASVSFRGTTLQAIVSPSNGSDITSYTEDYDEGSNFASGIFTAPTNGIYHFDGVAAVDNTAGRINCQILKGSVQIAASQVYGLNSSSDPVASCGVTIKLAAADTVKMQSGSPDGAITLRSPSQFSGYLVGTY